MRGSREILKGSEARLLETIEGISKDVSELLLMAGKVLNSAQSMLKESSSVISQVRSQAQGGKRKAKLALDAKREEIAREALTQSIAVELESERLATHSQRLQLLIQELKRWYEELKKMQENLTSWSALWKETRGRAVVLPSVTLLGRILRRMIRAASVIEKVNLTSDTIKVDIEGIERLRAEPEPGTEALGWSYKMPAELKVKLDSRLREEMAKLSSTS